MLTGAERKAFRKAVLAAFDYEGLKQALAEAPNSRDLGDLVSPEASFDDRTAQLITRSIKEGWVQELLQTLLEARRQKKEFVDAVGPIAERARSPIRQAVVQTRRRGPWIAAGVIGMLAVLWFAAMRPFYDSAARTLGVELVPMPVESVVEIERSIAYHAAQPNAGLIVMPD
jgi:hypothetical protein